MSYVQPDQKLPTVIELGIFRLISEELEPFEPRVHPKPWVEKRSRRWRRHLARERLGRGRRCPTLTRSGHVPAEVRREADRLPPAVQVSVRPASHPRPERPERGLLESFEEYAIRLSAWRTGCKEWEQTARATSQRALQLRILRAEVFRHEVKTELRCPGCSVACHERGRHVMRIETIVYTDDRSKAERLVERMVRPVADRVYDAGPDELRARTDWTSAGDRIARQAASA